MKIFWTYAYAHLKSFILQDFLNGHKLSWITEFGLIHNTKRSISNHLGVCVTNFLWSVRTLSRSCHYCSHFAAIFVSWEKRDTQMIKIHASTWRPTRLKHKRVRQRFKISTCISILQRKIKNPDKLQQKHWWYFSLKCKWGQFFI